MRTNITSLIVDDDVRSRNVLQAMIKKHCQVITQIHEASNIDQAIKVIKEEQPEIVFLDVDLGLGSGFDLLAQVQDKSFKTIFVTAHPSYAIKAIKWSAQDYILKPVDPKELIISVDNVIKSIGQTSVDNHTSSLTERNNIGLPCMDGLRFTNISEIVRCEAKKSYTEFFLVDGTKLLVSKSIQVYESLLTPFNFFRVHKSHLINIDLIKQYIKGRSGKVVMSDGTVIAVASRKKEEFLNSILH